MDLSIFQNDLLSKILLKQRQNTGFVGHVYNLLKQFKVQIIGILEEIRILLLAKNALMKSGQKILAFG